MIIGLTGSYGAGKKTVAQILESMNFYRVNFSDILKEELKKRNITASRKSLIDLGNELRTRHGPDILARLALDRLKDGENFVFTSIINPAEAKTLQQREDFLLVNITAPEETRLKRILQRNIETEPLTIQELREKEFEENSDNPNSQHVKKTSQLAKVVIRNDSSIEKLNQKVEKLVKDYLFQLQDSRPDWDHYFMNIAEQVKMRCNCMSAKKGAIIVKDKMILSTGYNGTPKGIEHCSSGGCPRCTSRHLGKIKSGVYSEPCICAHAEENAIVQAAYNGTSTKDAKMYTTFTPCTNCSKLIINAGIREVVAKVVYPDDVGTKLLKEAGVKLTVLD